MGYAIDFGEDFLAPLSLLKPSVQETILDDLEALAEHEELPNELFGQLVHPQIEWHRHRGVIDDIAFDIVTWVAVDHDRRSLRGLLLIDLLDPAD